MMSVTRQRPAALLLALSLVAALIAALAAPAGAQPIPVPISADTFTLTILHNNDGESKLLPDEDAGFPGVARFVARMKAMQAEAAGTGAGVVTLTSGDNFLASQELNVSLARDGALYDSIALSGLYDAMALGNHDFDLGPEVTARFIDRVRAGGGRSCRPTPTSRASRCCISWSMTACWPPALSWTPEGSRSA